MKEMKIDEFTRFKYLSHVLLSKDGKHTCFVVSEADKENNKYTSCIYELRDGKSVKLTNGGKESSYKYLDDDTLIFQSNREDDKEFEGARFYTIHLSGGEAELAYEFPMGVNELLPLKNGDFIVCGESDPKYPDVYKNEKEYLESYKKYKKDNEDYEIIEENPWYLNGAGFLRGIRTSLYYYDSKEKKLTRLSVPDLDVSSAKLSRDEHKVYFLGNATKVRVDYTKTELYELDLESKEVKVLVDYKTLNVQDLVVSEKGLYLFAHHFEYGDNTNPDLYFYDFAKASCELLCRIGESTWNSVGSDVRHGGGQSTKLDGDTLYYVSTLEDSSYLMKYEDGKISKVFDKEGSVDDFDVVDGKIVLVALYEMHLQEIYDGNLKALTCFNNLDEYYVAKPESLHVNSRGEDIHGFVLKPKDYDETKKYPVIIDIHGGPKTVYGPVFYHEMQYWANEGFFVIFCNPVGSDGRGNEFMDIRGKYGTIDYEDIMNFCDKALETYPQMDADHFFETGGSYGGFMTNWIIGHTNRFKACASQRSISNWFSFYGVSDIGIDFTFDQQQSTPFNNPEKCWWHSPMKYADQVKTPTLFIHSNEDYRCPMSEGMQMYTSLIAHGVDAKLVYFKGENHELSRSGKPLHRIKRLEEITGWFKKYLDK